MGVIAFASCATEAPFTPDDRLAIAPLTAMGHTVVPLVWDAGPLPPDLTAVVVRACWDYHVKLAAFRDWLDDLERGGVTVINPIERLRWNLDKCYLRELAAGGVQIPRTIFLPRCPAPALTGLLELHGLEQAVVKPAVSLSAHRTWRCDRARAAGRQAEFAAMLASGAALLQSFIPEIQTEGELSLVYFDRRFSHAVRKRPRAGDFRVQRDHGGTCEPVTPAPWIVERADRCLALVPGPLSHARVDGVVVGDQFILMELELIDPVLFLEHAPGSAERFAAAIAARL